MMGVIQGLSSRSAFFIICASLATTAIAQPATVSTAPSADSQFVHAPPSAIASCPKPTDPKDVALNAALAGQTITVKFERFLDLDHNEHAALITLVYLENTSGKTITEYDGREMITVDGIVRSERV
jgi:hypothetical protein